MKKGVARSWFGGALAAWGIWLRKAGAALLDALCHVFSGEAESVRRRTSSPPPCTLQAIRADTQGWRPCQKARRKKKRKGKTETRAGLQIGRGFFLFWARLTVAFPCFCLRCGEPLLSHSPHLLAFFPLSFFLPLSVKSVDTCQTLTLHHPIPEIVTRDKCTHSSYPRVHKMQMYTRAHMYTLSSLLHSSPSEPRCV